MLSARAAPLAAESAPSTSTGRPVGLVPQPQRQHLPLRVPVVLELRTSSLAAEVLGSTASVLLLEARLSNPVLPPLGTLVRVRVEWDHQIITGRLAAHGAAGRFLVSLGEREIRRSRRFNVNLTGTALGACLQGPVEVRITDLSTGGARIEGVQPPIGSDLELCFTPPGRVAPITVSGFVVRSIDQAEVPTVGVAFRLSPASTDVLAA
jgi:hypothetical protein